MNTGWWAIDIHGCYSLVKIAFAPICACKNNRWIWRHNASILRLRDVTDQLWWRHNAQAEKTFLGHVGDNVELNDRRSFLAELCVQDIKQRVRNRIIHSLPWITIFWSLVRWFANDFHEWRSHEWKSLANHLTRDQKIVIHGNSCIILYIYIMCDRIRFLYSRFSPFLKWQLLSASFNGNLAFNWVTAIYWWALTQILWTLFVYVKLEPDRLCCIILNVWCRLNIIYGSLNVIC